VGDDDNSFGPRMMRPAVIVIGVRGGGERRVGVGPGRGYSPLDRGGGEVGSRSGLGGRDRGLESLLAVAHYNPLRSSPDRSLPLPNQRCSPGRRWRLGRGQRDCSP